MKIICGCGQEMVLAKSGGVDEKGRIKLNHTNDNDEEIEIYEFAKDYINTEHSIAFHCNGCSELFTYNIEHRD